MNDPAKGVSRATRLCGAGECPDDQRESWPVCERGIDFSVTRDVGFLVNRDDRGSKAEGNLQHNLVGVHPLRGYSGPSFDLDSPLDQLRLEQLYKAMGLNIVMGKAYIVGPS